MGGEGAGRVGEAHEAGRAKGREEWEGGRSGENGRRNPAGER